MSDFRIIFVRDTAVRDHLIVEATSKPEAIRVFLDDHPDIDRSRVERVVLVPE